MQGFMRTYDHLSSYSVLSTGAAKARLGFDLDLIRSSYAYFDAYINERISMCYVCSSSLLAKNSIVLNCRYFDFFDPCDVIFDPTYK